tara:strand:- start:66 stop:296 length:231 start_codon:yes stop_codon:yes gene_type:complete
LKFYLEILEKKTRLVSVQGLSTEYYIIKNRVVFSTKAKVEQAFKNKTIAANEKKRIHQCYHADGKNQGCKILKVNV